MLYYEVFSQQGSKSPENEDSYYIPDPKDEKVQPDKLSTMGHIFVLCDGMGGHQAGEVASRLSADWLSTAYYNSQPELPLQSHLTEIIQDINKRIYHLGRENKNYFGLGTTLVSLLIKDNFAYLFSIGDSRIYLLTNGKLQQITEDQSPVWKLYRSGIITKDEMVLHPLKNLMDQALGLTRKPLVNSYIMELPKKFIYLICSDGLTDTVTDKKIRPVFRKSGSLRSSLDNLYELSQENGSRDDVTMILISNYLQ